MTRFSSLMAEAQLCVLYGATYERPCQHDWLKGFLRSPLHSQKRHGLDASCGFYRLDAICQQVVSSLLTSSSYIKSVNIRLAANLYLQTWSNNLHKACMQFATCSKFINNF